MAEKAIRFLLQILSSSLAARSHRVSPP